MIVDIDAIRAKVTVPPADIERAYNDNLDQYSTPEQVRASHILFRIEGKEEAAVKAKAEDVLKQARAGADFGALAKKYSEDEASAKNGGDLDYLTRGRMVPEFDQVAFTLQPGQISDSSRRSSASTSSRSTDKKPGTVRTLAELRPQLTDQLSYEEPRRRPPIWRRTSRNSSPSVGPRQGREGSGPERAGIRVLCPR